MEFIAVFIEVSCTLNASVIRLVSDMQQPPNIYLVASGSSLGIPYIYSRTPSSELQIGHSFFMIESYLEPLTRGGMG